MKRVGIAADIINPPEGGSETETVGFSREKRFGSIEEVCGDTFGHGVKRAREKFSSPEGVFLGGKPSWIGCVAIIY